MQISRPWALKYSRISTFGEQTEMEMSWRVTEGVCVHKHTPSDFVILQGPREYASVCVCVCVWAGSAGLDGSSVNEAVHHFTYFACILYHHDIFNQTVSRLSLYKPFDSSSYAKPHGQQPSTCFQYSTCIFQLGYELGCRLFPVQSSNPSVMPSCMFPFLSPHLYSSWEGCQIR